MPNRRKDAPSAVEAALGADNVDLVQNRSVSHYHSNRPILKPIAVVYARSDGCRRTVKGKNARALIGLLQKRQEGFTRSDMSGWEGYLPSHIAELRERHRLDIQSTLEPYLGGFRARYVILSPVEIREIIEG